MPSPKMMTVMCPNCQHRFPAPGCCNPEMQQQHQEESNRLTAPQSSECKDFYGGGGGARVPRGFTRGNGCFINAPTIINGPTIIQSGDQVGHTNPTIKSFFDLVKNPSHCLALNGEASNGEISSASSNLKLSGTGYHMITNGDHTGGGVTITTPRIQSGGCLVECIDSGVLFKSSAEIRPQLSDVGFSMHNQLSTEIPDDTSPIMDEEELRNLPSPNLVEYEHCWSTCKGPGVINTPPSGCQELPGMRSNFSCPKNSQNRRFSTCSSNQFNCHQAGSSVENRQQTCCCYNNQQSCCCQNSNRHTSQVMHVVQGANPDLQLSVNATLQLPADLGQCTINFTASSNSLKNSSTANPSKSTSSRSWNNFNGGGIIQPDNIYGMNGSNLENRDNVSPSTPVSWLMPSPWSFDSILIDQDIPRLCEVKKMLMTTGWYYPELNWKQSQELVKGASVGSWLIRDSSDKRYSFSVTVQIPNGATSVRVHYCRGQFRFDAVAKFATMMRLFDSPIEMMQCYMKYSKEPEEKREVWLDCNSGMRRKIYLTKPLVKEVRSLSHLARLAVNTYELSTYKLPPLIRKYLAEYPYKI